ncbi:hypothetical protein FA13DRAFT_1889688, partial [Coprinellus micaceus]
NLRYSYQPAGIAYVNSVEQVSEIVKVGYDLGYIVVARSGGVHRNGLGGKDGSIVSTSAISPTSRWTSQPPLRQWASGLRIGQVANHLNEWGRALPHATDAYVGWGGQTGTITSKLTGPLGLWYV